jgi:hypothetical protein
MEPTELSKGLYPPPPNLSQAEVIDPSHHFWVIKHGIKASGMPAWGKSMGDAYIWNMVAFLKVLPTLSAGQYQAMVAGSGGHAHGGGGASPMVGEVPAPAATLRPPRRPPRPSAGAVEHRHADALSNASGAAASAGR